MWSRDIIAKLEQDHIQKYTQYKKYPDFKIEILEGGKMPTKANPTDAGWDCYARIPPGIRTIGENSWGMLNLGFKLQIPEGWEVQIRGRSGFAANRGTVAHFGTIDHLYREEVACILLTSSRYVDILDGERVCQMVFSPVYPNALVQVGKVEPSSRGGFGSTGT